ncbi:hypothetical protein O6U64_15735 [Sphingomonas faeni]
MNAGGDPCNAKTKATAIRMTAGVEPSEARHGMLALACRYTRSHIRHAERSRHAGPMTFVDFHPVVEGTMTVDASHAICDRIEAALKADHPDSIISIHVARGQAQAWCDGNRVNPVAI